MPRRMLLLRVSCVMELFIKLKSLVSWSFFQPFVLNTVVLLNEWVAEGFLSGYTVFTTSLISLDMVAMSLCRLCVLTKVRESGSTHA